MKPLSEKEPGLDLARDHDRLMKVKRRWLNNKSPYAPLNLRVGWLGPPPHDYRYGGPHHA